MFKKYVKNWFEDYNILFLCIAVTLSLCFGISVYAMSPVIPLALMVSIALVLISLCHPQVLVYILISFIPLQAQIPVEFNLPMGINVFNLLFVLIYIIWFFKILFSDKHQFRMDAMGTAIVGFILILLVSMLWSTRIMGLSFFFDNIEEAKRWMTIMLIYFPVVWLDFDEKEIRRFVWIIVLITLVVSIWTLKDCYQTGFEFSEDHRVHGPFAKGGENDLSAFFVFYAPIALAAGIMEKSLFRKIILVGVFFTSALAVFFTYSRGAYLGLAAVLGIVAILHSRKLLIVFVLLFLTLGFWMPDSVMKRASMTNSNIVVEKRIEEGERALSPADYASRLEKSSAKRIIIWRGALDMIKQNPVFGLGYMTFYSQIHKYANLGPKEKWDTHQQYLKITAEMGIIGLIAFLSLLIVPLFRSIKLFYWSKDQFIKGIALGGIASITGIAIVNLFGSRFVREELIGLYFIFCAILSRYYLLYQAEKHR